jgi:hypothetical protein
MDSVVFLLLSSSIISMLGGKIQEPCIQKVYLGFLKTDPTKEKPQHKHWFFRNLFFVSLIHNPHIFFPFTEAGICNVMFFVTLYCNVIKIYRYVFDVTLFGHFSVTLRIFSDT